VALQKALLARETKTSEMGGCATKPKVLKEAPAPEPAKDDKPSAAPEPPVVVETPVVVVVGVTEGDEKIDAKEKEVEGDKVKEIVDDDKVDDQDSKRRSLSILFKEVIIFFFFLFSPCN
jgi:hypothetical protein